MDLPNIGEKAPLFSGINQDGKQINLSDYKGKKVVLFFYPKASTPGCTAEACDLQSNIDRFIDNNYEVIGVSADSVEKQKKFAEKYNLQYNLIADENKEIINAYGVWGEKKFMGKEYEGILRTTFIIDEKGFISDIIRKVNTKEHSKQILEK